MLLCAIQQNDMSVATDVLQTMNDVMFKEPMTAYLAFKVALKQQDTDGLLRCLRQIVESSSSDPKYLYACCLEAQQAQDKITAIKALQHIFLNDQFYSSNSVHLAALSRVLIRLEVSILNSEEDVSIDGGLLVEDICNIFEAGKSHSRRPF